MIKHSAPDDRYVVARRDNRLSTSDLPRPDTSRWVARRKAEVVTAISNGLLSERDACARYHLSREELASWQNALEREGIPGLRAKNVQLNRKSLEDRRG